MINELHQLCAALLEAGITTEKPYPDYRPIPNITRKAPCIRIVLDGNEVAEIESVPAEKWENIKKFGNNQGSFPAMNLVPLFRVSDEGVKKVISQLIKEGGSVETERIMSWCKINNWSQKFRNKYKISFEKRTAEIQNLLQRENSYEPINKLIQASSAFRNPDVLHEALTKTAFDILRSKRGMTTALQVLFYLPTQKDEEQKNEGTLSVVLDTYDLVDEGLSTIGPKFAKGLNRAFLASDSSADKKVTPDATDAFGRSFIPLEEPMPKVKLAAGFDVSLRTMFKGQPCQHRYGKIENGTYPISKEERIELSAALEWLANKERANKTWVSTDKGEAMFIFPSKISAQLPELTGMYQSSYDPIQKEALFEAKAKDFAEYITKTKEQDPEHVPEWIQFFILRKLDKARTKIVYSYNAKPDEIVQRSDDWQKAAKNLPEFHFGTPWVPFPLRIADVLNDVWKQDGTLASDKYKEVSAYFGMELFFSVADLNRALRALIRNAVPLGAFAGAKLNAHQSIDRKRQLPQLKETLALMGMLLYWKDIRKDEYMNEYPYLFGQLLKAADGLHELYCMTERKRELPTQLVGSSMYQAAMEFPSRTLAQLVQRLSPYLGWARTHQNKSYPISKENGETVNSPRAGYYLSVFNEIAGKLANVLTEQTRFNDTEKAQVFIGYLASFPKKEIKQLTEAGQTVKMDLKGDSSHE